MFPPASRGLRRPTRPTASTHATASSTAHRRPRATVGVFAAFPLMAALLLVLCSYSTAQTAPLRSYVGHVGQLTDARRPAGPSRFPTSVVMPTIVEVSARQVLRVGNGVVTATCPQGDYALGGGWTVPDTQETVSSAQVSGATWQVSVHPNGHQVGTIVTAYAECLAGAVSAVLTQHWVESEVGPNSTFYTIKACGDDETLVGGGFKLSPADGSIEVTSSEPIPLILVPGEDWSVAVENHSSATGVVAFYAECLSGVMAPTYPLFGSAPVNAYAYFPQSANTSIAAGQTATLAEDCPTGYAAAGGGFAYNEFAASAVGNLYGQQQDATATTTPGTTGWQGSLYNAGPASFSFYVTAVCVGFVRA